MGVNFLSKSLTIKKFDNNQFKLEIWDIAGQERFHALNNMYFKDAHGCFVVYDISNKESFNNLNYWLNNVKQWSNENIPLILIGNKCDLNDERKVQKDEGVNYARENNIAFFETSAKENINITEMFEKLVEVIVDNIDLRKKLDDKESKINIMTPIGFTKDKNSDDDSDDNNKIKMKNNSERFKIQYINNQKRYEKENYKCLLKFNFLFK